MATYFVFGNAPSLKNLLGYTGKDETAEGFVKIKNAVDKSKHHLLNINGHMVGAQIDNAGIITAIYEVDTDNEGVRLLTILIEKWSKENSGYKEDIANLIIDDEMSTYLEFL